MKFFFILFKICNLTDKNLETFFYQKNTNYMKLATLCYVIDRSTNSTLMIYRNKKPNDYHLGKWNGLGGKFNPGESPEECAIREIEEESGLKVKSVKMKGFITFPLFDGVEDWNVFLFTAD